MQVGRCEGELDLLRAEPGHLLVPAWDCSESDSQATAPGCGELGCLTADSQLGSVRVWQQEERKGDQEVEAKSVRRSALPGLTRQPAVTPPEPPGLLDP